MAFITNLFRFRKFSLLCLVPLMAMTLAFYLKLLFWQPESPSNGLKPWITNVKKSINGIMQASSGKSDYGVIGIPHTKLIEITEGRVEKGFNQAQRKSHPKPDVRKKISLKERILSINREQKIHNQEMYNLSAASIDLVIFVQVHNRFVELEYLIESLNKMDKGRCLVVFSHDVYLENVNSTEAKASFPYMQIYFPYSIQLYPSSFPGQDPNDCPRSLNRKKTKRKCNNIKYPDMYHHYREAVFTQTKHHFLWNMNFVFEKIRILKHYKGLYLRLEEDYIVAKDLLHVSKLMNSLRRERFPDHTFMIMGVHYEQVVLSFAESVSNVVYSRRWCMGSGRGMAFDRQFWLDMKTCAKYFCEYDDFGWDWSLWYLAQKCLKQPVNVLEIAGDRVLHIGLCKGMNHKARCKNSDMRNRIESFWDKQEHSLFPAALTVQKGIYTCGRIDHRALGGWGDPRDVGLCYSLMDGDGAKCDAILKNPFKLLMAGQ